MSHERIDWSFSNHPVSDIRDWADAGLLELRPDYQRREVWSDAARTMLIDTILRNFPMPKVYLFAEIKNDDRTYRAVIDGQQRLSAILSFVRDEFPLGEPCPKEYHGQTFSTLPTTTRKQILSYKIDVNEVFNANEQQLREMYSRVNKYTKQLNKQELRRADFPGDFLSLSEELALDEYLAESNVFLTGDRRRMGDTEFISELLAALLAGAQDKKSSLDSFYQRYARWPKTERDSIKKRFAAILTDLQHCFDSAFPLRATRFRQKSDFYSLFLAIDHMHQKGYTIRSTSADSLKPLRDDLACLHDNIAPTGIPPLSEYAIRCVSDANSSASRQWRIDFLEMFLMGTYTGTPPTSATEKRLREIFVGLSAGDPMCPCALITCPGCNRESDDYTSETVVLAWPPDATTYQLSNSEMVHVECIDEKALIDWKFATPA